MPAGQDTQVDGLVAPVTAEYVPAMQLVHKPAPASTPNEPAGQAEQDEERIDPVLAL